MTSVPASAPDRSALGICRQCETELRGRYCHECGLGAQSWVQPWRGLLQQLRADFVEVDRRLIRTLARLLIEPGAVPLEYADGRRLNFTNPIRLFLLSVLVFVLVTDEFQTGSVAGFFFLTPIEALIPTANRFEVDVRAWAPTVGLLVGVPVHALSFHVFFWKRGAIFARDLVFTLYWASLIVPLSAFVERVVPASFVLVLLLTSMYSVLALRGFYALRVVPTLARAAGALVFATALLFLAAGIAATIFGLVVGADALFDWAAPVWLILAAASAPLLYHARRVWRDHHSAQRAS